MTHHDGTGLRVSLRLQELRGKANEIDNLTRFGGVLPHYATAQMREVAERLLFLADWHDDNRTGGDR